MRYLTALLLLVSASAYGATFGDEMSALGLSSFAWGIGLGIWGGLASAFIKATPSADRTWTKLAGHLVVSSFAGLVGFLAAKSFDASYFVTALTASALGFTGAEGLKKVLGRYLGEKAP